MMTKRDLTDWLVKRDHFCILTHRRPDGDTLGSAAALCLGLRKLGKSASILKNPEIQPRFAWLHEGLTVDAPGEADVLICVDVASPGMLPKAFECYQDRIALRIDHHSTATSFTPEEYVEPEAAACGEIIYELLMEMWVELDSDIGKALYVAVSTDTGCFRFSNTTARSFLVGAACASVGVPVFQLNQELFETNSLARLRMQGWMVENAKFLRGGEMAICAIPRSVEEAFGATEEDMDNISGFPRTIAGVRMAATLREEDSGVKMSVRAVPGLDAAAVCARFGGGGHKGAAGANIHLSLEEAAVAVEQVMLSLENDP